MSTTYKETLEIRILLEPIIGEIRIKTYFSYYGLIKNNIMFALYKDGNFYLRKSKKYESILIKLCPNTLQDTIYKIQAKNFHFIPSYILRDIHYYKDWILSIFDEIQEEKRIVHIKPIRRLPNMNLNIERMLNKNGIHNVTQLLEMGAVKVFIHLIMQGVDVNKHLLFKLDGAIKHKISGNLTHIEKESLIIEVNSRLNKIGSRKRF